MLNDIKENITKNALIVLSDYSTFMVPSYIPTLLIHLQYV